MSEMNDGGPAFPLPDGEFLGQDRTTGMSLRDYFAGQALAGFCAQHLLNGDWAWNVDDAAQTAYAAAAAMLAERAKKGAAK